MADSTELIVVGGLLAAVGGGVIYLSLQPQPSQFGQLPPDVHLQDPIFPESITSHQGAVNLVIGNSLTLENPQVAYDGPAYNIYTFAQIKQGNVTVYASGVAGVAVGPASTPTPYSLVSPSQLQPDCSKNAYLTLYPWPSTPASQCGGAGEGICGKPAALGLADLYLQIYQDSSESGNPADANGFSSPTCYVSSAGTRRVPVKQTVLHGKINFVAS